MNFNCKQMVWESPRSTEEALAVKDAALRSILGYLEHKHGPGEWFQDELAYRVYRMVTKALEANGEPVKKETPRVPSRTSSFQ